MARYYLDSSAAIKLYQAEEGSREVERIVSEPHSLRFISRLTLVEVLRAFSRRLRTQEIAEQELERLRFGLYEDLHRRRMWVKEVTRLHYRSAARLVQQYASTQTVPLLRTLDALHLAVALDIREREGLDFFVCADQDLCAVAEAEQLSVLNPTA
jgi:predicted nucleic acid-binding protein